MGRSTGGILANGPSGSLPTGASHPVAVWGDLVGQLMRRGHRPTFRVRGRSMMPTLADGDLVTLEPLSEHGAHRGDVVAFRSGSELVLHRVLEVRTEEGERVYLTAGDARLDHDGGQLERHILGRVVRVREADREWEPSAAPRSMQSRLRVFLGLHPRTRAVLRGLKTATRKRRGRVSTSGRAGADA